MSTTPRLAPLLPNQLSPEQAVLYNDIRLGIGPHLPGIETQTDDGALLGPWNAWIHEPVIGGAIWNVVKIINVQAKLPENVRQIAILTVGAHFNAAFELYAHATLSTPLLGAAKVAALSAGNRPNDLTREEACAFDVADALVKGGPLPESLYTQAVQTLGQSGTQELIFLVGVYCLVSVSLNGFDVQAPQASSSDVVPKQSEYQTVNPTNGEKVKIFPETTDDEVFTALDTAHRCYETDWKRRPVAARARIVGKAAAIMRARSEELARYITLEMGKLINQSRYEVGLSANILEYYATHAEEFLKTKPLPESPGAVVATEPIGAILAIEPWNFPYYQLVRVVGPQIAAGNVLIVKHAPSVPQCALAFAKIWEEAGAPEGVYTNLFCTIPQVNKLIDDFRVRGVTLTGSERAGASVAGRAGRALKKVVLELGGSDPFIVLEDAPLDEAVSQATIGRLVSMGQACVASKRFIIIGKERGQAFLEGLKQGMGNLQIGDPADASTSLGPLFSQRALDGLLAQISSAKAAGARIVLGGNRIERPGYYLEPTIITDIAPGNPLYQEETFGPIASVYVVDTEKAAIDLANATKYGLGATVFGGDISHAQEVASHIDSGMVFVNSIAYTGPEAPFGGVKNSGFGRELSELGIGEFVNRKLIRTAGL